MSCDDFTVQPFDDQQTPSEYSSRGYHQGRTTATGESVAHPHNTDPQQAPSYPSCGGYHKQAKLKFYN